MGVIAEVLTLLGPSVGIKRVTDLTTDSPRGQLAGRRTADKDSRLVDRQDQVEAPLEGFLDVLGGDTRSLPHHFRRSDQEALRRSLTSGADLAARSVDDGARSRRLASDNSLRVRSRCSRSALMRRTATAIRPPTTKGATRRTT